jgi:hypothetical protein
MNPFQSLHEYEVFIYTLPQRNSSIVRSTLVIARRGRTIATLQGEIFFVQGYRLIVRERLSTDMGQVMIESYGYEIWHNEELLYWYDSQPHPDDPTLQSTHPHHKHIHPNIKHNRVPAPQMSLERPNIPVLIEEIEAQIQSTTPANITETAE